MLLFFQPIYLFMKYILLTLLLLAAFQVQGSSSPNFILILTDDQGWTSLSKAIDPDFPRAKSDYHKTPNMDALLEMGVNFTNGYSASSVCSPSRYSIQFGKTPARIHKTIVVGKNKADHNQIGLAQLLKSIDSEYYCAHLGKWHIDADPARYGYDLDDGITKNKAGNFNNNDSKRQWGGYVEEDPKRADSLTERTIDFIKEAQSQDRPFFVQLSHYAVHSDIVYSAESYAEMQGTPKGTTHKDVGYAAMIMDLDKSIGKLLSAYEDLNLNENTYIIFTSDNGGMPVVPLQVNRGRPYPNGMNSPLVRGKWDMMEGGIRVPFAIAGPGIKPGLVSDTPVVGYDLLPTVVELAQKGNTSIEIELPENLDGGSLAQVLGGDIEASINRPTQGLIFHFPHYNICGLNEPHSAIRDGDYKLVEFYSSDRKLLFDMRTDISESKDLSKAKPALVQKLSSLLHEHLELVGAEVPEDSFSWEKRGQSGAVKTKFFQRYD